MTLRRNPILFVLYRSCQGDEGIGIGDVKSRRLLFADDLVLLASSETDLQCSLERFAAECDVIGMRVNASKPKNLALSLSPTRCSLQMNGEAVELKGKFKYLGIVFTNNGKWEEEIDRRIGAASGVLRELAQPTVTKAELSLKTKLSIFKSILPTCSVTVMSHGS
ncbi:unnamed protein product [Soboliphyme baturini]|uniref:Reverse transcriptase domain-containing protein n=1 Tax=Soboliphyme baturini TaxID=241478 RepID=A0A183IJ15_9BILA|nr:unnamed protein product [Soboliphyme baturini]